MWLGVHIRNKLAQKIHKPGTLRKNTLWKTTLASKWGDPWDLFSSRHLMRQSWKDAKNILIIPKRTKRVNRITTDWLWNCNRLDEIMMVSNSCNAFDVIFVISKKFQKKYLFTQKCIFFIFFNQTNLQVKTCFHEQMPVSEHFKNTLIKPQCVRYIFSCPFNCTMLWD